MIPFFTHNPSKESVRKHLVNVVFIIYWLLIFEGALRKWAFPSLSKVFYFIRDPFVLYTYILAIRYGMWPRWSPLFLFGTILSLVFIALALFQELVQNINPLVGVLGWRNYFWYLPLAFIIGEQFKGKDLARLVRQTLLVAIPIAALVFLQFKSPPTAFVNRAPEQDSDIYLVTKDIVRTMGTFTFSTGQVAFISSIIPMALAVWLLPFKQRPLGKITSLLATAAVLVNFYVSGSRSVFFSAAFSLAASLFSALVMTSTRQRLQALFLPGLIGLIGAIFYVTVFATAYEAMVQRQETAMAVEGSTLARAVSLVTKVFENLPRSSLLGYGVGIGSNAGAVLHSGARKMLLSEMELPRIVDEAGIFGIMYITFRVWLTGNLFWGAIVATRRSNNPLPLLLFSYEGVTMLVGAITMQGTINGYGWLFAGFCLAANQLGKPSATVLIKKVPRALPA
jgi:hypothetical protein